MAEDSSRNLRQLKTRLRNTVYDESTKAAKSTLIVRKTLREKIKIQYAITVAETRAVVIDAIDKDKAAKDKARSDEKSRKRTLEALAMLSAGPVEKQPLFAGLVKLSAWIPSRKLRDDLKKMLSDDQPEIQELIDQGRTVVSQRFSEERELFVL